MRCSRAFILAPSIWIISVSLVTPAETAVFRLELAVSGQAALRPKLRKTDVRNAAQIPCTGNDFKSGVFKSGSGSRLQSGHGAARHPSLHAGLLESARGARIGASQRLHR